MKIFLLIILLSISTFAQAFDAVVVKITDADTIDFKHSDGNRDRARLIGIDSPEVARSQKEIPQPYANVCRELLETLLKGKIVKIETTKRDGYGRNLARVILNDVDINLFILNQGCAHLYYPNGIDANLRASYENAFLAAKNARIGLFSRTRYVTPTVWRRKRHLKRIKTK